LRNLICFFAGYWLLVAGLLVAGFWFLVPGLAALSSLRSVLVPGSWFLVPDLQLE